MTDFAPLLPWLFGIGIVAVLVGGYLLDRKRRERIMTYCLARGWQYVGEDLTLADRWSGEPFGSGDRRRARNVIRGNECGRDFVAFDYSYDTHSTDSQGTSQVDDPPLCGLRRLAARPTCRRSRSVPKGSSASWPMPWG